MFRKAKNSYKIFIFCTITPIGPGRQATVRADMQNVKNFAQIGFQTAKLCGKMRKLQQVEKSAKIVTNFAEKST